MQLHMEHSVTHTLSTIFEGSCTALVVEWTRLETKDRRALDTPAAADVVETCMETVIVHQERHVHLLLLHGGIAQLSSSHQNSFLELFGHTCLVSASCNWWAVMCFALGVNINSISVTDRRYYNLIGCHQILPVDTSLGIGVNPDLPL